MIEYIKKLLKAERYEVIAKDRVKLEEKSAEMEVEILGLPNEGLTINPTTKNGKNQFHPAIIADKKNYKKSCDYLIIVPNTNIVDVYFIELKKTISTVENPIFERACDQILYTIPAWKYLVSMVAIHHPVRVKIEEHYVVITKRSSETIYKKSIKDKHQYEYHEYKNKGFTLVYSPGMISFKSLKCPTSS